MADMDQILILTRTEKRRALRHQRRTREIRMRLTASSSGAYRPESPGNPEKAMPIGASGRDAEGFWIMGFMGLERYDRDEGREWEERRQELMDRGVGIVDY
jgi:hypothetical protein